MPTYGAEMAIIESGKVLLIKRRDFAVWALPGGAIDAGESAAEAAVREAREETGLDVELLHMVGVYSRPAWSEGGDHDLLFAARPIGGTLISTSDETLDADFFAPDALPEPLIYWYRQRIIDALSGARGIARRQHTPWPFADDLTLGDLRRQLAAGELKLEDLAHYFRAPESDEGTLETHPPDEASDRP